MGTANREGTHMEISFWLVKGDIPNEKIRLPPLEVHFGVGGCGRTDSAGGLVKNKVNGGFYNKLFIHR